MPDPLVELAGRTLAACAARGLTLATAESCTGGLVAHLLTEVPGSSAVVRGGVVAYADDVKRVVLNVPAAALTRHGAVSAQVALAMAAGVRGRIGSDIGLAITGIAGPDGGTPEKPVGLVYVAVAAPGGAEVERHLWTGDRSSNKQESARAALELALRVALPAPRGVADDAPADDAPADDAPADDAPADTSDAGASAAAGPADRRHR